METEKLSDYAGISELIREKGGQGFDRCCQCGHLRSDGDRRRRYLALYHLREMPAAVSQGRKADRIWGSPSQDRHGVRGVSPRRGAHARRESRPYERRDRAKWAEDLSVKEFSEGTEILYFACCYQSYDPRLKKVAEATAKLLNQAGVDYGILGSKDSCCGESIRKTGSEEVFKRVARDNIKSFIDNGVQKILVSSPHCYETFKNEYPDFRANFEVVHISEFLLDLVQQGRLELKGEYGKKVAYHDPCYLGRHNGIYEAPRSLLQNVSGLELEEMKDSRADSLCCGGGGGRVWMETHKEDRFSDLRIQQAVDVGAEVLATSCPYCI